MGILVESGPYVVIKGIRTNLRDNRTFLDTLLSIRTQGLPAFTSPRRNYSW